MLNIEQPTKVGVAPTTYVPYVGRAYPNDNQQQILAGWFGSARYVYNSLLSLFTYRYEYKKALVDRDNDKITTLDLREDLKFLEEMILADTYTTDSTGKTYNINTNLGTCGHIVGLLKARYTWLQDTPNDILTQSARDLCAAYSNFYKKVKKNQHIDPKTGQLLGLPKYRRKYGEQSLRLTDPKSLPTTIDPNQRVRLPTPRGLKDQNITPGSLRTRGLRTSNTPLKSITIRYTLSGLYFVTCLYQQPREIRESGYETIGIDMMAHKTEVGAMFDGTTHSNVTDHHPFPTTRVDYLKSRIVRLQQVLSKKTKGSKRRSKIKLKLARTHYKLKCVLDNYYHHITSWLVKTYQTICVETLNVKAMMVDGIKQINRLVQDSRFTTFIEMLRYKIVDSSCGRLLQAHQYYPSTQICSSCNTRSATKIELGVKVWTCGKCKITHNRDDNASVNIYNISKVSAHKSDILGDIVLSNNIRYPA